MDWASKCLRLHHWEHRSSQCTYSRASCH